MAVVFLGAFVELNLCGPQAQIVTYRGTTVASHWGWPLPFFVSERNFDLDSDVIDKPLTSQEFSQLRWVPWTHQTYRIVHWFPRGLFVGGFILCGVIDVFVALIPLALILFLQIPRCRAAAKGE